MRYELNTTEINNLIITNNTQETCYLKGSQFCENPFVTSLSTKCELIPSNSNSLYFNQNQTGLLCPVGSLETYVFRGVLNYINYTSNNSVSKNDSLTSYSSNKTLTSYSSMKTLSVSDECFCDWSTIAPDVTITQFKNKDFTISLKYIVDSDMPLFPETKVTLIRIQNNNTNEEVICRKELDEVSIYKNQTILCDITDLSPCAKYSIKVMTKSIHCYEPNYELKPLPPVSTYTLDEKLTYLLCTLDKNQLTVTWKNNLLFGNNSQYYYNYVINDNNKKLIDKGTFKHNGPFYANVENNDHIEYSLQICMDCLCGPIVDTECKYDGDSSALKIIIIVTSSLFMGFVIILGVIFLIKRRHNAHDYDLKDEENSATLEDYDLDSVPHIQAVPHYDDVIDYKRENQYDHLNISTELNTAHVQE